MADPPPLSFDYVPATTNDGISPFMSSDTQGGPPKTPTQTSFADPLPFNSIDTETLVDNARVFARRQMMSTPSAKPILRNSFDPNIKEQKTLLGDELVRSIIALPKESTFASSLYHKVATRKRIDNFLKETEVYDMEQKRWKLPQSSESLEEKKMYKPLVKLLNAILEWFWGKVVIELGKDLSKAIDTSATPLWHQESVETGQFSRPDISIKSDGSSFQLPHRKTKDDIGFSNMATCFEVKVENQRKGLMKELLQLAVYARQIFIQQPNRQFVRLLLITEQNFRLFHFDRSGVQHTEEMDLHSKYTRHIFIRLVLGLSSPHESDLGLDTSIEWEIKQGLKVGGTLKAHGNNSATGIAYKLAAIAPIRSSFDIRGCATTYWRVIDPQSGETLLVKDSWRSEERVSEREYLEEANDKRLPGVVHMISCEENRDETKRFRGFEDDDKLPAHFYNRISIRILMDCEGHIIYKFDTKGNKLTCPDDIPSWTLKDSVSAAGAKESFLCRKTLSLRAEEHWPESCKNLLMNFGDFLKQFSEQKIVISRLPANAKKRVNKLTDILSGIDRHYETVLQFFDAAIQDLKKEQEEGPLIQQTPAYSIVSSSATASPAGSGSTPSQSPCHHSISRQNKLQTYRSPLKRIPEEYPDDQPEAKRGHASLPTPETPTPKPRVRASHVRRQG
ncbi:hypothetical protein H1R20_g9245, partial [Candolleomyces eurysporus]